MRLLQALWLAALLALPASAVERSAPSVRAVRAGPPAAVQAPGLPDALPAAASASAPQIAAGSAAAPAASAAPTAAPAAAPNVAAARAPAVSAGRDGRDEAARERFEGPRLRIVHVAAEAAPFTKTGGLGAVMGVLPRRQAELGHDVTKIIPKFQSLDTAGVDFQRLAQPLPLPIDGGAQPARVWEGHDEGVRVLLLEHPAFERKQIYGAADLSDSFIALPHAAIQAAAALRLRPDVFHAHDWHTALLAPILKLQAVDPAVAAAKTVLTGHNFGFGFQGWFSPETLVRAGFSMDDFTFDKLAHEGQFNFLKAGIQFADAITTVSDNHRRELLNDGFKLQALLRYRADDFYGFPNALDRHGADPATDSVIYHRYNIATLKTGKALNKAALQRELGLAVKADAPLFGVASRLTTDQKGMDMVLEAAERIVASGGQLVVVGVGEQRLVDGFTELARRHPRSVRFKNEFSSFARKIYAAADFLLMPSRFEPGGLSNKEAQAFGTLPIVTPVGGLVDSTRDVREHADGNGFLMREVSTPALVEAIDAAFAHFAHHDVFDRSRHNAMSIDPSWDGVRDYVWLYRRLTGIGVPR